VVEDGWQRFVVADIPGLIEGAHEGAGLGLDFLRHIERTRAIVHLVDGSSADPRRDVLTVNEELQQYGQGLQGREQILVVNKIDIPEVRERREELEELFGADSSGLFFISAATGEGVPELVGRMAQAVAAEQ